MNSSQPQRRSLARRDLELLAAIVALGLAMRLYGLTSYGIWFDEGYHLALVRLPSLGAMLAAVLANPPSDPLYVLLLRGWIALFGSGDAAARSLSVLLSTATLPVVYGLGRVLAGRGAGLLAALLLALSPYAVEFGQEAALYALASLTTTAALAASWRLWQTGRGAWLYAALGIIAIYSHYVVAPLLALFALLLPIIVRSAPRIWLVVHAAIFAAWLPWLVALAVSWASSALPRATLRHPATVAELVGALVQYSSGTAALASGGRFAQIAGLLLGAALLIAGLVAGWHGGRGLLVIVALFLLLFLPPALVSALTGLWLFVSHFMLFLLPALFVVFAAGVVMLLRAAGARRWLGVGLLIGWLAIQITGLGLFYTHPPHGADGLRELAAELRGEAQPDDVVLVTPPSQAVTLQQYYDGPISGLPSDFDLREVYLPYDPAQWNSDSLARLEQQVAGKDRFWLVYRPELDAGGEFLAALRGRYHERLRTNYEYGVLFLFTRQ